MSDLDRPDPDELLAAVSAGADASRGVLRVYLGMCPGVGKTFAMLEDAHRQILTTPDLLIGVVETHGRVETEALVEGLNEVSKRAMEHRGAQLWEFDLDETLKRKPSIVLIDELAHSNAQGCRHPKRWQDVEELLAAGIEVWTTLNIQHVESLCDTVMSITGIRVRETIPDAFLEAADEIRIIDITPEQLRRRLSEGKVYLGEQAVAAAEGFFRHGNLQALREMALRLTARKVEANKRKFMRHNLIPGPWRTGERFLVAVGSSPYAERLIRITCRLAQVQDAGWVAVHIETGKILSEQESDQLSSNLALARSLGGEPLSYSCDDPVRGLLHVARRENVTQIVAGKAIVARWWRVLAGRQISDRLQHESGEIDLLLVHPGQPNLVKQPPKRTRISPPFREIAIAGLALGAATLLGAVSQSWMDYRSVTLYYLLAVAITGIFVSRGTILGMAVASSLAWNYFFTEPRYTFSMLDHDDYALLVTLLVMAAVVGHLTSRLRQRERASIAEGIRSNALYRLTRAISASPTLMHAMKAALSQIQELFSSDAALFTRSAQNLTLLAGTSISQKEESVCLWALEHGTEAGRFTNTLPEAPVLALPLSVNGNYSAVLALRPQDNQLASPLSRDLLEGFAAHLSVILEKEQFLQIQREAALTEKTRQFQRALLDHVSHEIKTPVAVIQGASDQLVRDPSNPFLPGEIREAAVRLNRVFNQLVTLSRVEAGLIDPSWETCEALDLMREAIIAFPKNSILVQGGEFTFQTDPSILGTVLFNLLQNALQYGNGEAILIGTHEARTVQFQIINTGQPIPEKERDRVFERFHRGESVSAGGLGLGLPIARQFAALLRGEIRLDSSDLNQTIFSVVLPQEYSDEY